METKFLDVVNINIHFTSLFIKEIVEHRSVYEINLRILTQI